MQDAIWQARKPRAGFLTWDILNAPVPDVPCSGVIMLAGGVDDTDAYVALVQAACRFDVPVLIASTQAVYGPQAGPLSESAPCAPNSVYGAAKLAMEQAVKGRPGVTCLRIGNIAGTDALFRSMAAGPVRLDQIAAGQGPRRAMIGPVTLAHTLLALLETDLPPILNLAQPGLVDMADILRAAKADWRWQDAPDTALAELELDVSALAGLVHVPPADATTLVAEARATGWVCA
jgi:dTDP-4-dehydrorhamnose reductase